MQSPVGSENDTEATAAAVAAATAINAGYKVSPTVQEHEGDGGQDKALTSRFRGVCWNKKNKRWQAAINSSGKYVYLGKPASTVQ